VPGEAVPAAGLVTWAAVLVETPPEGTPVPGEAVPAAGLEIGVPALEGATPPEGLPVPGEAVLAAGLEIVVPLAEDVPVADVR
jgi:hypothetical protein